MSPAPFSPPKYIAPRERCLVREAAERKGQEVHITGWILHLRVLSKTTFLVIKDVSGVIQCVMSTDLIKDLHLRLDDCIEINGLVNLEPRSKTGVEILGHRVRILNKVNTVLPFNSGQTGLTNVSPEILIENRPLVLRSEEMGEIFRLQASVVALFRKYLTENLFTEIFTSKIVASGTEGGTNLFQLRYFEKTAYLAQSPQFYKEHCVAGLERVFETAHVYRAEPHATSRHLTEYLSLDVELAYVERAEEVIELERGLLEFMFENLNELYAPCLKRLAGGKLPSFAHTPIWEFGECVDRLKFHFGRNPEKEGLEVDLDPIGERQLCELAEREFGTPSVFVVGFPLQARPFYTAARGTKSSHSGSLPAEGFDLLFRGLEITTGGIRLHRRSELESAIQSRGLDPQSFESHLRMFDLGMPPHGGFAIGAERLTSQILKLANVREATLYPRDRNRITP